MGIDLKDFEAGKKYPGDYAADLAALQERLSRIQVQHIIHGRAAIIAVEGWDAAGKGGVISRLTSGWDPRWFQVWPIAAPDAEEKARPFLFRFWKRFPGKGEINIFDRTWYGRVLVERVEGYCSKDEWQRAYAEINAFEAELEASGITLIKLFMHVTQEEQDKRLLARLKDPWKRWKTGTDDFRNRARRADYLGAYADMFDKTDTKAARWTVIDGNNKKAARIAALTAIAEQLETHVPATAQPADPAVVALAEAAFGQPIGSDVSDSD